MVALLAVVAASFGPPAPVLHSRAEELVAARGSFCWVSARRGLCVDTVAPVTERSLPVRRRGRVTVDMRTVTESLTASLRGRSGSLRVRPVGGQRRRYVVRMPQRFGKRPVLDLFARYPRGDGSFGARLRLR